MSTNVLFNVLKSIKSNCSEAKKRKKSFGFMYQLPLVPKAKIQVTVGVTDLGMSDLLKAMTYYFTGFH